MQERAGPSQESGRRRTDQRPAAGQAHPADIVRQSTTSASSFRHEASQHASNATPQTFSASSVVPSPLESSRDFSSPLPRYRLDEQMIVGHPQPPGPTRNIDQLEYGGYGYAPSASFPWDWENHAEIPDFARPFEASGDLVKELEDQPEINPDFALPEPVTRAERALRERSEQSNVQRSPATVVLSPAQMPIVLGTAAVTQQQQQQQQEPRPPPPRLPSTHSTQPGPSGLKRKSESDAAAANAAAGDASAPVSKKATKARGASIAVPTGGERKSMATRSQSVGTGSQAALTADKESLHGDSEDIGSNAARPAGSESEAKSPTATGPAKARRVPEAATKFSNILPAGKVFPIQIGSELFRLSGASISSDGASNLLKLGLTEIGNDTYKLAAPSYFSHFFSEQLLNSSGKPGTIRTLYIDRDPQTFKDISLHLQGYHVKPRDGEHYVRLFADAQFYSLPRLTQQLFKTDIYIQIGDRNFQIPRDIFSSPGNSPNFFSLGFAHFFSTPSEVFPGLDRTSLLRPPSIQPPSVPNRSADVFEDLLHLLQGYPVNIRDENHRQELLRDARYFHLKGLEQKLIPCNISFNLARQQSEIVVRLEDIRQSGVVFQPDHDFHGTGHSVDHGSNAAGGSFNQVDSQRRGRENSHGLTPSAAANNHAPNIPSGYIRYARPFTDEASHTLIVETSVAESARVDLATMRATFSDQTKARIASLFQVIANKMNLPATQPLGLMMVERGGGLAAMPVSPSNSGVSGDRVRVAINRDAWCEVNGGVIEWELDDEMEDDAEMNHDDADQFLNLPPVQRWRPSGAVEDKELDLQGEWVVNKAHWRLRVQPSEDDARIVEVVMQVVKLQAWAGERSRNGAREFLL